MLLKLPQARTKQYSTVRYSAGRTQFLPFIEVCGTAHGSSFKIIYSHCYTVLRVILFPCFARDVREFSCTFTTRMSERGRQGVQIGGGKGRLELEEHMRLREKSIQDMEKNVILSYFFLPFTEVSNPTLFSLTCSIEYNKLIVFFLHVSYKLSHLHSHPTRQHPSYLAGYAVKIDRSQRGNYDGKECLSHVNLHYFFCMISAVILRWNCLQLMQLLIS